MSVRVEAGQVSSWNCNITKQTVGKIVLVAIAAIAGALAIANLVPNGLHFPVAATYSLGGVAIASLLSSIIWIAISHCKKEASKEEPSTNNIFGQAQFQKLFPGIDIGTDPALPAGFDIKTLKNNEMLVRIPKIALTPELQQYLDFTLAWSPFITAPQSLPSSSDNTSEWVIICKDRYMSETDFSVATSSEARVNAKKIRITAECGPQFQMANLSEALLFLAIEAKTGTSIKGICCEGFVPDQPLGACFSNSFLHVSKTHEPYGALAVRRFPA